MEDIIAQHDWTALSKKYQQASPFPSVCIDNFLELDAAKELASAYPSYSDAKQSGREFRAVNENLKTQITDPEKFPNPVQKLSALLASNEFLEKMEELTGIKGLIWDPKFVGGGMHLTKSSGLLDVHVDFNFEKQLSLFRRVNILIYLNPVWDESWGGNVELWDSKVKNCVQSFPPVFNRCVIFSTSDISFHGVTAVKSPEGVSRNSFAAYYYSKDPGDNAGDLYGGNHTTIFKARPYEYKKKYVSMPLDKLQLKLKAGKQQLKKIVRGG